jgi:hypothetical protein
VNRRIPQDAFECYYALGQARSYEALAERYGVSRRAIAKVAAKEGWKERVRELDLTARQRATEKLLETAEEMSARHLKVLRFIQSKAIEAIRSMPSDSAMDGVKAYTAAVNQERLVRGEPTERAELDIAEVVRRESARWLLEADGTEHGGDHGQAGS